MMRRRDSHEWLMSSIVEHEDNECLKCGVTWFEARADWFCPTCRDCEGRGGWMGSSDNADVEVCWNCQGTGRNPWPSSLS